MKKSLFLLFVSISLISSAQSVNHLKVYCTDKFNTETSITVEPPRSDYDGLTDMIKNGLVMNGFKVISEDVAKRAIELTNKKQMSDTSVDQKISIQNVASLKSVYVVTFSYQTSVGNLTAINGQVVDLVNDGEIVATFSYQHSAFGARTPKVVVEALCKDLHKNKKN